MATLGTYLYGFADGPFQPSSELRGIGGEPVRAVTLGDVSAVVSSHRVERLAPRRSNLEPHHRVVRDVSHHTTLVPAAFGHITDTDAQILDVIHINYAPIREELDRLHEKWEMSVKVSWTVPNIFAYFVRIDPGLRALRDRIFSGGPPSVADKLQVGGHFEAALARERARGTQLLLHAFTGVAVETATTPARAEQTVCQLAMLVDRGADEPFQDALRRAAALFDEHYTLEYGGPWPAYSFVRLRLQAGAAPASVA
jgi:Gas vesicle synthesis protein GvpL/GvpF